MLARPHLDAAWRPILSYQTSKLLPALRDPPRRRGLRAVVAARKAAAEAPSAEAETASRETNPKKMPSWVPWDEQALREQQQALAEVQASRSIRGASAPAVRTPTRSSGKFVEDFKEAVNEADFKEALEDSEELNYAYFCNGEMQWFGVNIADADIKKAGFVTKWLGFGGQSLGPVRKADGTMVDRELETWLPKKIVKAWSLRSKKMGTRTIAYQDGQVVFFKAIMDNALGEYLGTGLPDISGKYNDRVARNEGKITGFLDELSGRSAYKTEKGKTVKERLVIPKPLDPQILQEVDEWLQTKEEWDREKVCMAELGYIPDEANPEAWPTEEGNTKDEEAALSGKIKGRRQRQPRDELSDDVREFAERALLESKRAVAKLDTGSWNVGSVITDKKDRNRFAVIRTPRRRRIVRGAGLERRGGDNDGQNDGHRDARKDRVDQGAGAGWQTATASGWATTSEDTSELSEAATRDWRDNLWDEPQPEPSAQRPSADIQPLDDEVGDAWATVNDELDEMPNLAPEPALKDEKEDSDLLSTEDSSSAETDLKARPTPRPRVGSIGADAWLPRRGDMAQRGAAQRSTVRPLQRDAGAPRRAGWTTSGDELSGWTEGNDVATAGPQGWAASDNWVDDSAAAAGRFFEAGKKPARPGSQGWASGGWSENSSIVTNEDVDGWADIAESAAKGQDRKFSRGGFSEDLSSLAGLGDSSTPGNQSFIEDIAGVSEETSQDSEQQAPPAKQQLPAWLRHKVPASEIVRGEDAGRRRRRALQSSEPTDAAREATPPMKGAAQSDPFQPSTGLADDTSPDEWKAFLASDLANEQLDHEDDDLDPEDQEIAQVITGRGAAGKEDSEDSIGKSKSSKASKGTMAVQSEE